MWGERAKGMTKQEEREERVRDEMEIGRERGNIIYEGKQNDPQKFGQ